MAPIRRRAVLIGVNHCGFDLKLPSLRYAESDAQALRNVLLDERIGTFDDDDVHLFVGPDAAWSVVKARLREIALDSRPSDMLLVYFAGHALRPEWSRQLDAYLVTDDLDPDGLRREPDNGLRLSFLKRDVFEIFQGTSLLVLDCCHAGTYVDADLRHAEVMQTYPTQLDRHSALLACPGGAVARESAEHGHGVLTREVLRALRGDAADATGAVSFERMVTFVAEQGLEPPPVKLAHTWGPTVALTQPPLSRHDRQALAENANPCTTRACKNPLDDLSSSVMQLLGRMFRAKAPLHRAPQQGPAERVEIIRYALDADSVAWVEFSARGTAVLNATARFDRDTLGPLLRRGRADALEHRTSMPGWVVADDAGRRLLCVPVSYADDRTLALTVVEPAAALLDMGEPLAVMLRTLWDANPLDDPVEAEVRVLTALRTDFGRLPLELYEYAFSRYQKLVGSMTMVFQPVVELDQRAAGVSIQSFEALARRGDHESRAPWAALQMAHSWGDRFVVERDALLLEKAVRSYAAADAAAPWQGTKALSVNVAVRSLLSDSYLAHLGRALTEADLNPRTLTLEISEQDPIEPGPGERWPQKPLVYFHHRLTELARELRISFAVDDFGVGYASLARMAELPLTQIKVDRAVLHHPLAVEELSLVARVARDALVRGQAPSARAVIVEGYDDKAPVSLRQIYELGIHHVQGFLFGEVATPALVPLDESMRETIAALVRGKK
ncbi:EAL domain-containing protein [Micromonospora sp. WMMD882]|uniref:EAL domain-containing protein n=1 Tax=Micromonospora sp. WMMD882 TaxID=3015151 RepID=UPI00248C3F25|nr:EAL domain-containing protein [Micromonospora sp. WMMD882]WBB80155.1 EAL domain-containing protein [Micromonospora sp. WMMD882]